MHRKYWLVATLVYVLVLGLALYNILQQRQPRATDPPGRTPTENSQVAVTTYLIRYRCRHEVPLAPQDGLAGVLRMLGIEEGAIEWEADTINSAATSAMQTGYVDDLCRECQTYLFVGVKDGYVAVYYGIPRSDAELKFVTDIPLSRLPPDLQQDLAQGVLIRTEEELNRFLEGIDQ